MMGGGERGSSRPRLRQLSNEGTGGPQVCDALAKDPPADPLPGGKNESLATLGHRTIDAGHNIAGMDGGTTGLGAAPIAHRLADPGVGRAGEIGIGQAERRIFRPDGTTFDEFNLNAEGPKFAVK